MPRRLILADDAVVRYATGALMYFAQGIPQGLLSIAIPAWLATMGVGAAQIGSYLAVVILPWAFKLVTGPLMDRYEFLPMGRRRPWVLGAQLGLTLSLLALILVERPTEQIGLLMLIGVIINSFAATQDVAVDGMAIDLTPVREQGRLNAFMSFGKAIGWATTAAVSGILLDTLGIEATAIAASATAGVVLVVFVFVLEHDGERRLPWSAGKAASVHQPGNSFADVFGGINKVLWGRASVVVLVIMFFDGLVTGYGQALMPIAAVNLFGYTTAQWSQLVAIMGLIGAIVALGLGPLIDRFGSRRMLLLTISLVSVHAFVITQTQHLWESTLYARVMLSIWVLLLPVVMVCVIALGMAVCSSRHSATQFAIYMSVSNLGYAAGSKTYGMVSDASTFVEAYLLLGIFTVVTIFVVSFHRHREAEAGPRGRKKPPAYTIGLTTSEGGVFWSGAMRCPKCRSDMEQIDVEGIEIDRCLTCNGIWFDAGEAEALRNRKAAVAIDVGEASVGKIHNVIDDYRCPRCGGSMSRMVDRVQRHIWFEKCDACEGTFFDAGEFLDLSRLTVSDLFKRFTGSERG
ncbi:MAG: MFS transporter [Gemmatimonadales bacterium]|nr:MAG: MFS transporter [Gemmatimonadales bacterium]